MIDLERREDPRGFFARAWCQQEFAEHGLETRVVQCNLSHNERRGTVRGMHYQLPPHAEVKIVRCTRGAVFDVIVDIRPGSSTYGRWIGVELSAENGRALYIPEGFAHGYQALEDGTRDVLPSLRVLRARRRARASLGRPCLRRSSGRFPTRRSCPTRTGPGRTSARDPRRPGARRARGAKGTAHPRRAGRRRVHGPRDRPPDRDGDAGDEPRRDREPDDRQGARRPTGTPARDDVARGDTREELERAIAAGRPAVTEDAVAARGGGRRSTRSSR